jgi:hypothetical protein
MTIFSRNFPNQAADEVSDADVSEEAITPDPELPEILVDASPDETIQMEVDLPAPVRPAPPPVPSRRAPASRKDRPRASSRAVSSTAADEAAVRETFEDLAVGHVLPVRNLMLTLRFGDAPASWIELARPALRSLRAMAGQLEMKDLCAALDVFAAALDEAAAGAGATLTGAAREALLVAYEPMLGLLPRAFELDGERDRREPVIVQALLRQVPGLDPLMRDRLLGAGLGRLDALLAAHADDLVQVAALPTAIASALVAKLQELRQATPYPLATADAAESRRALETLLPPLETRQQSFERAAQDWSPESLAAKRRLRREREQAYLPIKIALARLGDVDFIQRLEPLPWARRVAELQRYLREGSPIQA